MPKITRGHGTIGGGRDLISPTRSEKVILEMTLLWQSTTTSSF